MDFQSGKVSNSLVVSTTTAFSAYWLIPRLAKFYAAYPDVDVRLAVDDRCVDLKFSGIHVSIRYGKGDWSGVDATYLCDSDVIPVCSLSYWQNRPQISDPQALLDEFLIEFDYVIDSRWSSWFENLGVSLEKDPAKLAIDSYTSLVQAALNGQGIALLGSPLVDDFLANGTLIAPTVMPRQKLPGAYYLVTPKKLESCPALEAFHCWMMTEMNNPKPE